MQNFMEIYRNFLFYFKCVLSSLSLHIVLDLMQELTKSIHCSTVLY